MRIIPPHQFNARTGLDLEASRVSGSVGFFFSTMWNVVDTHYAGFISIYASAALSVSTSPFPVFF